MEEPKIQTNRLKFVNIDQSQYNSTPSTINGLTVIKAQKGTTKFKYIPPNNATQIVQTFGTPSATYPDVQELLDFNAKYGCWVSAPAGSFSRGTAPNVVNYNSYFGGVYLTTKGSLEAMYQHTEDTNTGKPSFTYNILCTAGNTASPYTLASSTPTLLVANTVTVDNLPLAVITAGINIIWSYKRSDNTTASNLLTISGTDVKATDSAGVLQIVGSVATGTFANTKKILISGNALIPDFNFQSVGGNTTLSTYLGNVAGQSILQWSQNIQSDALMAFYQSSIRAITGSFAVSKVDLESVIQAPSPNANQINPYYNTVKFTYTEDSFGNNNGQTYVLTATVSPDSNKVDGQGGSLYAEDVLAGDVFLGATSFVSLLSGTWTTPSATLVGQRAVSNSLFVNSTDLDTVLGAGWDIATSVTTSVPQICFDPSCNSSVIGKMNGLTANTGFPFATFVSGSKVSNAPTATVTGTAAVVTALGVAKASLPVNANLTYYCNEFLQKESYNKTTYYYPAIGAMSSMLAQIMEVRLGGADPIFINEGSPGLGGQIAKTNTVLDVKYKFNATDLDNLDAINLNPIILDPVLGVMATSGKTAQSPVQLTDYSFLGHTMSFNLFKDAVRANVMLPQIGKLIDPFHMSLRKTQTQALLDLRLKGANAIWASGIVLVEEVNTDATKATNTFMITVRVKVYPFSEYVTLTFINEGQNSTAV